MEENKPNPNYAASKNSSFQENEKPVPAAGDQFAYQDLPPRLLEAEERRRQSLEKPMSGNAIDTQNCFEKPEPVFPSSSQKSKMFCSTSAKEPRSENIMSIPEEKDASYENPSNQRMDSLMQENRVLKCELETYKLKIKSLQDENKHLRQDAVHIQAKAEQEEEFISNTLLKKIQALKKEKENLAINYEQEEEYLTNDLTRKLEQLRQEKVQLEHTLEQEQECLVNKLMRRIEKLESETTTKQASLEALRREKVELENTLEQEQEALVNKLWKRMDHLEKEKRVLQVRLDKPISEPPSPRSVDDFNYGGGTASNLANNIRSLKKECARLKQQLISGKEEHEKKMAEYAKEEKETKDENLRLQRRLQLEVERREALCRQLSESESSIEMEEERAYNELSFYGANTSSASSIGSFTTGAVIGRRTRSVSSEFTGSTSEGPNIVPLSMSNQDPNIGEHNCPNKDNSKMSSKRKKTEESESQETFYISTEPSPLAPKSITETQISEKDKNTNTNDSDSDNGDPNQNEISTNTPISASNYSETKYHSDSEGSTPLSETQERKKSYKTKKDPKSSVRTTYGEETISRNRIKYSETAEKSLEQFLFGKSTEKQGVKRKLDSEESSECSESSEGELDSVELSKENSKIYNASSNYKSDNEVSSSEDETEDGENESKDLPTWSNGDKHDKKHMPAWHDKDDLDVEVRDVAGTFTKAKGKHGGKDVSSENYAQSLRRKFKALKDIPKWADFELQKKNAEEEDSDDEFFRETTDMLDTGKKISLSKGFLEYRKLKDINEESHTEGTVIRAAEFHPTASVGLVAGLNGTTSLFQIDGKSNPKMQTINFENYPIKTAHFTADGKQFIVGSPHFSHFFMYDMIAGKNIRVPWKEDGKSTLSKFVVSPAGDIIAFQGRFGNIHIYSDRTRSNVFTLKMNDEVTSCTFSPDGELLYSHGMGGEVYVWDIKAQDCLHRFWDDGCVQGTAIGISRNNRYLATGSTSGIVNVYSRSDVLKDTKPTPQKIIGNLTTAISDVKFNPTSEILAMASEVKENAIKLLHVPSMTVFQNFPPMKYNLRRPNCMDFSTNGGYFSVGNNRGAANLFRLKYFGNY